MMIRNAACRVAATVILVLSLLVGVHSAVGAQMSPVSADPVGSRPVFLPPAKPPLPGAFAPGRVLVTWRENADKATLVQALNTDRRQVLQTFDTLHGAVIAVPPGEELAAIAELQANPLILTAEPDVLAYAAGSGLVYPDGIATPGLYPNDLLYSQQWGVRRVDAPSAWPLSTGQADVLVAMIDSGIDLGHPEFAGRIVPGFDYVNQDNLPQDDYGHGTHIAGIVAAAGNNARGVAGVAWQTRLLVYKVLDNQGLGPVSNVIQAVLDANFRRAAVINLSLALTGPSELLHSAIRTAYANGAVIVGVTGNESGPVTYPALYEEVIAVAATNHWEDWAGYSNYGPQVDLAAPGGSPVDQILSTGPYGSYIFQYGTSSAAPHVAATAALMRAVNPQLSNATIAAILRNTADKVGSFAYSNGRNDFLGFGRLNTAKAVRQALPPTLASDPGEISLLTAVGQAAPTASLELQNPSSQPLRWQLVEISADWLDVDPPWAGSLAFPATATLRVRVIATLPVGVHGAFVRLRTTTLGGQQQDLIVPVRLAVARSLQRTFLPLVDANHVVASWVDAADGGSISIALGDDGAQALGLPFSFPFYGVDYSQMWVHANGFLSFGRGFPGSQAAANGCIPSLQPPDGAIYALWDDLDPSLGGQVFFRNVNNEYVVVEWRDVPRRGSGGLNTFQVLLWPDGRVLLSYQTVAEPASATVGLENWDNTMGWQMACNGSGVLPQPGRAWLFLTAMP